MDLNPLREFIERHDLHTAPEWCVLDALAQLGDLSRTLLKETNFGRDDVSLSPEVAHEKIGNVMFALTYLSLIHDVDPEGALWDSVRRFEKKLEAE
jgi:NTP pyrophosphatase (non-canonical NTP hydrolase)